MAYREAVKDVNEKKEVNVKDTYKTVAAIIDYDRAKKGSKDATYDSMKGDKKAAKKERDYAAFERGKMKKDDPNWKSKKYHTGMHGEETEVREGYGKKKKKKHDCASKVKHEEFGIGDCIKEMHDLDVYGNVAHYDVLFSHGVEKHVPVSSLEILEGSMHEHVIREKMAAKDYDGDGKIESGKDEYFGSKDKAIKKAMAKRVKKESLSDWRDDLSDLIEIVAEPEEKAEKKVKESNVKNKVVINPKISEAIEEIGGEVLEHHQKDADGNTIPHDDVEEGKMYGYKGGGVVKKEVKALSTAARTMKGRNVAKADKIEEGHGKKNGKKNCGCGQDPCITYGEQKEGSRLGKSQVEESYDEIDDDLLLFVESSLGNFPEDQILDMMESMWHRRNPGKKHPLESGSSKVKRRPVSDQEKKSTDKEDRMYVAMRRVSDRQKGYSKAKSDAAGRLHDRYTTRQAKRKAGASPKEASAQSFGEFGGKDFAIKRGGRKGKAPATDRGTGNKAARRAGQEVKDRDPRKK